MLNESLSTYKIEVGWECKGQPAHLEGVRE